MDTRMVPKPMSETAQKLWREMWAMEKQRDLEVVGNDGEVSADAPADKPEYVDLGNRFGR